MKRSSRFLLSVVLAFLANATASVARPGPGPRQTSAEMVAKSTTEHPRDARPAARSEHEALGGRPSRDLQKASAGRAHAPAHISRILPAHTKQIPSRRSRSARSINLHQNGSNFPDNPAKKGLIQSEPYSHALPTPSQRATRLEQALRNPVHHRGADAAAIGGPPNASRNAAINGTSMRRKP
jgi:hypothetical protein